jgi:hypothetical protein
MMTRTQLSMFLLGTAGCAVPTIGDGSDAWVYEVDGDARAYDVNDDAWVPAAVKASESGGEAPPLAAHEERADFVIIDRTEVIAEHEALNEAATEVQIVHDGAPGAYADVLGLPAMSADGRTIAWLGYDAQSDVRSVDLVVARSGRVRHQIPLDGPGGTPESSMLQLTREVTPERYETLVALTAHYDGLDAEGEASWFTGDDLRVDYDAETGRLRVTSSAGEVIGRARARRQLPNGPGVGLMDPDAAREPMLPHLQRAYLTPDGAHLVAVFSACDCSCDIVPYPRAIALAR